MTKKNVLRIADWLLWTLLALLPVIVYLFEFIAVSGMTTVPTVTAFADVISRFVAPDSNNVIYTLLSSVFGSSDIAIGKLTTPLLQYFTYFVSDNWDRIIHLIKESYPVERKNASKHIDELRIIDSISTLCVSARILQVFLIERLNFSSSEADEFYNLAKKGIYHQAMMLYQAISNDDPDKWALSAIKQMIATRELRVVEGRPSLDELKQLDGYCDKNYVNFLPEKLFSAVKRMASSTGVFFSYNEDAFIKSLGEANIINSVKNGTGHRKYSSYLQIDNSKVKFVRIFKDKLEQ